MTYPMNNENEQPRELSFAGANTQLEQGQSIADNMMIDVSNEDLGYREGINLESPENIQKKIKDKEIRKQEVLPSYEGAKEKRDFWGTAGDVVGGLVEGVVDGAVVGSWAGLVKDENWLNLYQTKTAAGDFVRTAAKYITAGALAFTSGSALGVATKGVAKIASKNAVGKGAQFLLAEKGLINTKNPFVNTLVNKIFHPRHLVAGAYADYAAYSPEEGHLADILAANGVENPFINKLKSSEDDTIAEAKLKNVVEGLCIYPFVGVATDIIMPRLLKGFKGSKQAVKEFTVAPTPENAAKVAENVVELQKTLNQHELLEKVNEATETALKEGRDPHEVLRTLVGEEHYKNGDYIIGANAKGEKVCPNPDGSFSLRVEKWQDGYKVTQDEFNYQLMNGYGENGRPRATNQMEEGFREILAQRGVIQQENEGMESFCNRIFDYYKKKWNLGDNVTLEFTPNVKGKAEGHTGFNQKGKNKNIRIQVNSESPNKLASLRAELEHARDIATGNFLDRKQGQHFFRYQGADEREWAKGYLHKKSISQAMREGKEIPQNVLHDYKMANKEVSWTDYTPQKDPKPQFTKEQQQEIKRRAAGLLADLAGVDKEQVTAAFAHAGRRLDKASDTLLFTLLEKAKTGDIATINHSVNGNEDLFNIIGTPLAHMDDTRHSEEVANILERAIRGDFSGADIQALREAGEANTLIKQELDLKTQSDFYKNFYKELDKITPQNIDEIEKIYTGKIAQIETLDEMAKDEMRAEITQTLNTIREGVSVKQAAESSGVEVDKAVKAINEAGDIKEAYKIVETLLDKDLFRLPSNTKKVIDAYTGHVKTRTFTEALEGAREASKYMQKHLTDDVLGTQDIKDLLSDNFGRSRDLSNEMIAYTEVRGRIKDLLSDCNKQLIDNPSNIELLEKSLILSNNYCFLGKVLHGEGSELGRGLNEMKLVNQGLTFYKDTDGLMNSLTQNQRDYLAGLADVLTENFNDIYRGFTHEEFFTLGKISPEEATQELLRRLSEKYKDIDLSEISPDALNNVISQILKKTEGMGWEEAQKEISKYFDIYSKKDVVMTFIQGATMAADVTGFEAFKKYFGSNLKHLYIGNILSSPPTQMTNVLSGVINMALDNGMKFATGLWTGNRALVNEAADTLSGYTKFIGLSWEWAIKVFKEEQGHLANMRYHGVDVNPFAVQAQNPVKPLSAQSIGMSSDNPYSAIVDLFGGTLRTPSRLMGSSDELLTRLSYYGKSWADAKGAARRELESAGKSYTGDELEQLTNTYYNTVGRYFDEKNGAANSKLLYESRKLLYQNSLDRTIFDTAQGRSVRMEDSTAVSELGVALQRIRGVNPALDFVFTFITTPINIVDQLVEYTPAAALTRKFKNLKGTEKQMAQTKLMVGTATIGFAGMMALDGKITGGVPLNEEERRALTQSGWQPYSFVTTNPDGTKTYTSYKRLEPAASVIGLAADIANLIDQRRIKDKEITEVTAMAALSVLNNAMDKSYLAQGLDILSLLTISNDNDAKKLQKVMGTFLSGFIPFSSAGNWYKNDGTIKELRTFVDIITQRNPFVSNDGLMPSRNYFGETRQVSDKWTNITTRKTYQKNDGVDNEIIRLSEQGYKPYRPQRLLGDDELDTTTYKNGQGQTAYDKILDEMGTLTIRGKTLREAANELIESQKYQSLPDGVMEDEDQLYKSRRKALNALIKKYSDKAKDNVLRGEEYQDENGVDLKLAVKNWKASKKLSRVIDLGNELNQIF